jgi:hypothetical protein
MNPFQTMNARMNTAAASTGVDPRLLKGVAAASIAGMYAPAIGGAIDLGVGDTKAFDSGEIPLNYLIAMLGAGTTVGGTLLSEEINKGLDSRFKQATAPKSTKAPSAHDAEIKAKMKEILRTEGPDAAQAYFASQKNKTQDVGREGSYTRAGATKRRMAGALLSSILGAGVSLPLMVDENY